MARRFIPFYHGLADALLKGPLVGIKQASVALSQEYAQADPIYVAKTAVILPLLKLIEASSLTNGK